MYYYYYDDDYYFICQTKFDIIFYSLFFSPSEYGNWCGLSSGGLCDDNSKDNFSYTILNILRILTTSKLFQHSEMELDGAV